MVGLSLEPHTTLIVPMARLLTILYYGQLTAWDKVAQDFVHEQSEPSSKFAIPIGVSARIPERFRNVVLDILAFVLGLSS